MRRASLRGVTGQPVEVGAQHGLGLAEQIGRAAGVGAERLLGHGVGGEESGEAGCRGRLVVGKQVLRYEDAVHAGRHHPLVLAVVFPGPLGEVAAEPQRAEPWFRTVQIGERVNEDGDRVRPGLLLRDGHELVHQRFQPGQVLISQRVDDGVPVRQVLVQRPDRHAGGRGDPGRRQRLRALIGEQPVGGLKHPRELLPCARLARCPAQSQRVDIQAGRIVFGGHP